jgi:hypothetical protein
MAMYKYNQETERKWKRMGRYSMVEKERAQQNVAFCGARIELVVYYFFGFFVFFAVCVVFYAWKDEKKRNKKSAHAHTTG